MSNQRKRAPLDARIFVAGHQGLVGSAILRRLRELGYTNLLAADRCDLDLRIQSDVNHWFDEQRPEYIYLAAGTVGGIMANSTRPAEFIYDNMMIHATVVHASYLYKVKKLLYLGSSCIYPRMAIQPIEEDALLSGYLEPTNEAYAVAKIAGIRLCQAYRRQYECDFISAMPTNLYGPNDNFDLEGGHVLPSLIRRFDEASRTGDAVVLWGTGSPKREFLHVDDLAGACEFLMTNYSQDGHINVGTGLDVSILELAHMVASVVNPDAEIVFDSSKPDGSPRKLLNAAKLQSLGWTPRIQLLEGIKSTYEWYSAQATVRGRIPVPPNSNELRS